MLYIISLHHRDVDTDSEEALGEDVVEPLEPETVSALLSAMTPTSRLRMGISLFIFQWQFVTVSGFDMDSTASPSPPSSPKTSRPRRIRFSSATEENRPLSHALARYYNC